MTRKAHKKSTLTFFSVLRVVRRTVFMLFIISGFSIYSFLVKIFMKDEIQRRRFFSLSVHHASRWSLTILGIKVEPIARETLEKSQLLVGNHMGVLDILIIAAQQPTLFVTSVDMRETPGLGFITEMGGCLYVERRSRLNIHSEIGKIREALNQGLNITLYPEGMATNGARVYPFKKSLMTSVAGTGIPIKPLVVNFLKVNGEPMSAAWRDYVCWYGDQSFVSAMFRALSTQSIEAQVIYLDKVFMNTDEERRSVAETLHQRISERFLSF